jgi:hypothetical protein
MSRFLTCGLLLAVSFVAYAEDKPGKDAPLPPAPKNAQFDKVKSLVGTWVKADDNGKPTDEVISVIKSTAGGSAIEETVFPGTAMEMVSVYTVDGDDLYMTHYCILGNQPKLKADPKAPANQLKWIFVGGGNLDVKKDKHMHGGTLTIVDKNHIEMNGEGWENGAPAKEMCGLMKMVRKE